MPNRVIAASTTPVPLASIDSTDVLEGRPRSGVLDLAESGFACGLWEHTAGTSTDIEVDEVFVVLTGRATISIEGQDPFDVGPGDVVQLAAGDRTTWRVHEDLRKFWIVRP